MREVLLIIPTTKLGYEIGFSAPIGYMFSDHVNQLKGIFSFELNKKIVKEFEFFIIELNWHLELYEFIKIINFIKKFNKKSKILFGGLYSQLEYKNIFKYFDVNFFIKGDNELPIKLFLDGEEYNKIPNLITNNFKSNLKWTFKQENFNYINYNFDFISNYFKYLNQAEYENDERCYSAPLIVTSKICSTAHSGCEYCLGSKTKLLNLIYNRKSLHYSNKQLINLLKRIEKRYNKVTLYVLNEFIYDFSNENFDLELFAEIDSPVSKEQLRNFIKPFKKASLILPINKKGIMYDELDINYHNSFEDLKSNKVDIKFVSYSKNRIEGARDIYNNLDVIFAPEYAVYDNYKNFDQAYEYSMYSYKRSKIKFYNYEWTNEI